MDEASKPPPEGFSLSKGRGPYSTRNGPWYDRIQGETFERGFWVLDRHCNSFGLAHGGLICTYLDGLLAGQVYRTAGRVGVTVDLHTHFLHMARAGDWVQGDARVTRHAGDLVFVEGTARANGREIARGHAIFKLMTRQRQV
jgi:uncharacterized protein (TIGR00369 family)